MAISTYSALKTAIADWLHRTDMTTYLDDFIDMAEAEMNRELRMSEMESRATITASDEYVPMPTGALEIRNIQVNGTYTYTVTYKPPAQMDLDNQGATGDPKFYTIIGNEFQLYPVPSSSVLEVAYYKAITPLDSTNTTNFMLTSHPSVYLHGCLAQACIWARDFEGAQMHGQEFNRLLAQLNETSTRKTFSGSPLQVTRG